MHVHRGMLGWGVFFIVMGAVPLAVRAGVLEASTVGGAWQLWPLLLVGVGAGLVLARTSAAVVGSLIVAVTAGLMAGGLVATGIHGFGDGFAACGLGSGTDGTPFAEQRGTLGTEATVSIRLDCGSVAVASAPGSGWNVSGTSHDGRPPSISSGSDHLDVEPDSVRVRFGSAAGVGWDVTLPRDARTSFDLQVNAGSARGIFAGMRLDRVTADVNAGSAFLDLGEATDARSLDATVNAGSLAVVLPVASMEGSLTANAGSIEICTASEVSLRFHAGDNPLGSNNFAEAGLVQDGSTWSSPGYELAQHQVELSASANLGSITLNPDGGCQ